MTYEEEIKLYREAIDKLNDEIIEKIAERQRAAIAIGKIKINYGKPIEDLERVQAIMEKVSSEASNKGLDPDALKRVFEEIIKLCTQAEEKL